MPRRLVAVLALLIVGALGLGVTTALVRSGDSPKGSAAPQPTPSVTTEPPAGDPTPEPTGTLPTEQPTPLPTPSVTVGGDGSGNGTTAPPAPPITPNTGSAPIVPVVAALLAGAAAVLTRRTTCAA